MTTMRQYRLIIQYQHHGRFFFSSSLLTAGAGVSSFSSALLQRRPYYYRNYYCSTVITNHKTAGYYFRRQQRLQHYALPVLLPQLSASSFNNNNNNNNNTISSSSRKNYSNCRSRIIHHHDNNDNNNQDRFGQQVIIRRTLSSSSTQQHPEQKQQEKQQQRMILSVAIIGSGPSGCYTAKYLSNALSKKKKQLAYYYVIDILELLPTPYGLVRYGVAPDHPEMKHGVQHDFDNTLFTSSANNKGSIIRFYGNVQVGGSANNNIQVHELRRLYDIVVLAYGCQSDRKLSCLPGGDDEGIMSIKDNILSAREFVAWYNGHPHFHHIGEIVSRALLKKCTTTTTTTNTTAINDGDDDDNNKNDTADTATVREASVVVIGQGNVALDCARILVKGKPGLYDTDCATRALDVLGQGVAQVSIVGRRGHVQGAFTIKELRELVKLEQDGYETNFVVRTDELDLGGTTSSSLEELNNGPQSRPKTRINKLLRKAASEQINRELPKRIDLRFLLNPIRFEANKNDPSRLGAVICERTRLEGPPGQQKAAGTGVTERIPADLALVSIGYKAEPLPGTEQWFDTDRGVLRNQHGLVDGRTSELGGLYTAGWLKRGPSGIIGTNIGDAKDTVATILADLETLAPQGLRGGEEERDPDALEKLLKERNVDVVDWDGYQKIVQCENEQRRSEKQPREKIVDLDEQIEVALHR